MLLTVFTPTYNRAYTLKKCYESLVQQTSKNFVWQIIDDGSTDDTKKIVETFVKEQKIPIKYYYKDNGGKVSAINFSLDVTDTELWVCLDSDDYFTPNAVECIEKEYVEIVNNKNICGLFGLRATTDIKPMGGKYIPNSLKYSTQFNIRYILGIKPEYVQVYKTYIIKSYPYPIFEGEKFFPLSYMSDQLDQKYEYKILNDLIMVCEYLSDGITKNHLALVRKNPCGYREFKRQQIEFFTKPLWFTIKNYIALNAIMYFSSYNIQDVVLNSSKKKLLLFLMRPLGFIYYLLKFK